MQRVGNWYWRQRIKGGACPRPDTLLRWTLIHPTICGIIYFTGRSRNVLEKTHMDPSPQTDHAHLIAALSAMMLQLNALQATVHDDTANGVPDINAIRSGLKTLEQMTREMLYELRSVSDDIPLPELSGVTLGEALSRAVEEKAESLGLSSRIVFSGEERPLRDDIERLLYRIAQEALEQVQHHTNARKLRF